MKNQRRIRRSHHTVSILKIHLVWGTKYRYPVLQGDIQKRCRELLIQLCDADVQILKGVVSKDPIHMPIEYPPKLSISHIVDHRLICIVFFWFCILNGYYRKHGGIVLWLF
jgi:putative transposase